MLTERQLLILNLIIDHYVEHGEPIGSNTLLEESNLPVSPATIRNEMMRMEELGFLKKMHSSSGRIPSILGYRHYVDQLMAKKRELSFEDIRKQVQASLRVPYKEAQEIVESSAELLSYMTNYTALSIGPEKTNSRLTGFRLVPVTKGQFMAILVTDKGYVESKILTIPHAISAAKIQKMVNIFNEELVGLKLMDVHNKLQVEIPRIIDKFVGNEIDLHAIFRGILSKMDSERIYVGGEMNLLNYFNFEEANQREKIKSIYNLIHESKDLQELLVPDHNDISVRIGTEMGNELLSNFSLITASYDSGHNGKGLIALLGPTNMPYEQTINIMRIMRDELSDSMHGFYQNE